MRKQWIPGRLSPPTRPGNEARLVPTFKGPVLEDTITAHALFDQNYAVVSLDTLGTWEHWVVSFPDPNNPSRITCRIACSITHREGGSGDLSGG